MVKRLFLVLLVVCCVAGCGGPKPRTLENLTYAELTQLYLNEEKVQELAKEGLTEEEFEKWRVSSTERIVLIQKMRVIQFRKEREAAEKIAKEYTP